MRLRLGSNWTSVRPRPNFCERPPTCVLEVDHGVEHAQLALNELGFDGSGMGLALGFTGNLVRDAAGCGLGGVLGWATVDIETPDGG
jgi:hypothetical protein